MVTNSPWQAMIDEVKRKLWGAFSASGAVICSEHLLLFGCYRPLAIEKV